MNKLLDEKSIKARLLPPERLFPLIRQISYRVSPVLASFGLTPNMVTLIGLVAGLAAAIAFAQGTRNWGMVGALLWMLCYLMDYCDGEVARITAKSSRFGAILDDSVDWIVHSSFFTGLGYGAMVTTGEIIWLLLGLAAAAGTTMNCLMIWLRAWSRNRQGITIDRKPGEPLQPEGFKETYLYIFRGLFRADFWLLVLLLEMFHATWMLLPVFAIGVQVFWITGFLKGADRFVP